MKKTLLKISLIVLAAFLVLSSVLIVHIYIVTKKHKVVADNRQLSRIDFKQPINSEEANKIRSFVKHLDGVESTFFNEKSGILVYTYSLDKQSSANVYQKLVEYGKYKAERYIVNGRDLQNGCPIMTDKASFFSKISSSISSLFN